MDPVWLAVAFVLGFLVKQIGLPPLIGFLVAGFALNLMGVESDELLHKLADFGIMLLLFGIGLKLKIKSLFKREIWATASIHMLISVLAFGLIIFGLSVWGLSLFAALSFKTSLLIAFALSFSSTVFAVKILEENGAMSSTHGKVAIGILIMQDIFAVVYLTLASGKVPSIWALALLPLVFIPRLIKFAPLSAIINRSGHGELLVLLGILIPAGGAYLFSSVGLKPDLGAIAMGILLANHPKAKELSNAMLSFKDIFLVGFFLTVGLGGLPTLETTGIALLITLLLPLKVMLFYWLLAKFKLRARTATLTSFNLANYSEFGLIVGAAGVSAGWISPEWMIVFALALSFTFIIASPLNMHAHDVFIKWKKYLVRFERKEHLPDDEPIELGNAQVVVLGMGRTGTTVFNILQDKYNYRMLGIDHNLDTVKHHNHLDRRVIHGDADDIEFWQRIKPSSALKMVVLTTSKHATHLEVIHQIEKFSEKVSIAAICKYQDDMIELRHVGADIVFNLYSEAGLGYAEHLHKALNQ